MSVISILTSDSWHSQSLESAAVKGPSHYGPFKANAYKGQQPQSVVLLIGISKNYKPDMIFWVGSELPRISNVSFNGGYLGDCDGKFAAIIQDILASYKSGKAFIKDPLKLNGGTGRSESSNPWVTFNYKQWNTSLIPPLRGVLKNSRPQVAKTAPKKVSVVAPLKKAVQAPKTNSNSVPPKAGFTLPPGFVGLEKLSGPEFTVNAVKFLVANKGHLKDVKFREFLEKSDQSAFNALKPVWILSQDPKSWEDHTHKHGLTVRGKPLMVGQETKVVKSTTALPQNNGDKSTPKKASGKKEQSSAPKPKSKKTKGQGTK